jgi:hypothetical protein
VVHNHLHYLTSFFVQTNDIRGQMNVNQQILGSNIEVGMSQVANHIRIHGEITNSRINVQFSIAQCSSFFGCNNQMEVTLASGDFDFASVCLL